jgi:hypothetical protein
MNDPRPVPFTDGQRAIESAEVVRQNIATVLTQQPDLVSYDPTTDEGEMIGAAVALDPGSPSVVKDGWEGTVVQWGIAPWEAPDPVSKELSTVPSLLLIGESGQRLRVTGWPAIKSFAAIVRHFGKERCQLGVKIRVQKRPSSIPGRSYWSITPAI